MSNNHEKVLKSAVNLHPNHLTPSHAGVDPEAWVNVGTLTAAASGNP